MPERVIIPITTCKYERPKKGEIVKIQKLEKRTKQTDKDFIKQVLGKEKPGFLDSIVTFYTEYDGNKMSEFISYLELLDKGGCYNCGKNRASLQSVSSNDDDEIIIKCPDCFYNKIDGSPLSKEYVRWWNSIADNYGLNLKDGFPKAARAQWGTKCSECGGYHDGGGFYFDLT